MDSAISNIIIKYKSLNFITKFTIFSWGGWVSLEPRSPLLGLGLALIGAEGPSGGEPARRTTELLLVAGGWVQNREVRVIANNEGRRRQTATYTSLLLDSFLINVISLDS